MTILHIEGFLFLYIFIQGLSFKKLYVDGPPFLYIIALKPGDKRPTIPAHKAHKEGEVGEGGGKK